MIGHIHRTDQKWLNKHTERIHHKSCPDPYRTDQIWLDTHKYNRPENAGQAKTEQTRKG